MKIKNCVKGFTLIELLVVIAVLGVLAGGVVMAINPLAKINQAKMANVETFAAGLNNSLAFDLVGEWTFNDGTVNDTSGYGNITTNNGAIPASDRKGQANKAYDFVSGSSQYIDAGAGSSLDPGTGEFSASLWVKTSYKSANHHIISKMKNGSNWPGYTMYIQGTTGYLVSELRADGIDYNSQVNVDYADGNWHNFVLTVIPNSTIGKKLYVDGVLKDTTSTSGLTASISTTNSLFIGKYRDASSYFTGSIDDVRIYKSALLSSQVSQLYAQGLIKRLLALK